MTECESSLIKDINKYLMENIKFDPDILKELITQRLTKCTHISENEKPMKIKSMYNAAINRKSNQ